MGSSPHRALKFPVLLDAATDDRFDPQWKPIRFMLDALSGGGGGPETVRVQARDACAAMGLILRSIPEIVGVDLETFLSGATNTNPPSIEGPGAEAAQLWNQWNSYFYGVALRPDLYSIERDEAQNVAEGFVTTMADLDEFVWTRLAYWNGAARSMAEQRGWLR